MLKKKKRHMKNTDALYISLTPDWSALIASLRTIKGARLGPTLKKKLKLKHPKNDQETAKNAQKKFQNRPKRYYSKDLKSFKNSSQNHSKTFQILPKSF